MSRPDHDNPYRDDAPRRDAAPASKRPARPERARQAPAARKQAPAAKHPPAGKHPAKLSATAKRTPPAKPATVAKSSRKRAAKRPRGNGGQSELTSLPISRRAYLETREWLLEQHGPVCAYCGRRWTAGVMTLDHVAPRRGQTAYDRRDNLVLACPGCNAAKRDLAPLAFLLGARDRASNLLRYGAHLSHGLLDLARSLGQRGAEAVVAAVAQPARESAALFPFEIDDDGESPYRD